MYKQGVRELRKGVELYGDDVQRSGPEDLPGVRREDEGRRAGGHERNGKARSRASSTITIDKAVVSCVA